MKKSVKIDYVVTLTFDVDASPHPSVYAEVTELLAKRRILKTLGHKNLPNNLYLGVKKLDTPYEGEKLTSEDVKNKAKRVAKAYWNLVSNFFESKNLENNVFVEVARKNTTSVKLTG